MSSTPSPTHYPTDHTEQLTDVLARQAAMLAAVRDAVIVVDNNYVITEWNGGAEEVYGYTSQEAIGQRLTRLVLLNMSPEDIETSERILQQGTWRGQVMQRHKSGKWMFIESVVSPLFDKAGQRIGLIGINRDITEHKQAEERFSKAFHTIPAVLGIISLQTGTIIDVNEAGEQFLGDSQENIIGHSIIDLVGWVSEEEQASLTCVFQEQGFIRDREIQLQSKDGQLHFALVSVEEIQINNENCALIILFDITERKRAELALRESESELERYVAERTKELQERRAELSLLLEAMGDGVIYTLGTQIQYMNRAMTELSGYELSELAGKPAQWLIEKDMTPTEVRDISLEILKAFRVGKSWRGEGKLTRKDGSQIDAAFTVNAIVKAPDKIVGGVILVRDITEEKQLQRRKVLFLANASHELRTPLTNVKTRLYLLRKQPERFNDHMEILEKVTSQMTNLVNDLLDVSRFERGSIALQKRDITLQPIVDTVIRIQQAEAQLNRIILTAHLPESPISLKADPDRLTQVVVNLVVNAINYTPVGGKVDVWLGTEIQAGTPMALIRVADTGIGIEEHHLSRLFEPFYRVSEGSVTGTGLGLPIVHSIVELHGGTISVDSVVSQGTTFTVSLPIK